jgi:hypothetical protein
MQPTNINKIWEALATKNCNHPEDANPVKWFTPHAPPTLEVFLWLCIHWKRQQLEKDGKKKKRRRKS